MSNPRQSYSQPHKDDCFAIKEVEKGNWNTPWTIADMENKHLEDSEQMKYEDGTIETQVAIFRCNDPNCPGKVAVPATKILELLPNSAKSGEQE